MTISVGVGSSLVDAKKGISETYFAEITGSAQKLIRTVKEAKNVNVFYP